MKKSIFFIFLTFIIYNSLVAQIRLDVEGEAKIEKRLILGNINDMNMFIGYDTGLDNSPNISLSEGLQNTIIGNVAGRNNTTGSFNVFLGFLSGHFNTTGTRNTFLGTRAGYANTTASNNVFIGDAAGQSNAIGRNNTFLGKHAGIANTDGGFSVYVGADAGAKNTTGASNIFIGAAAGNSNTTGEFNVIVGSFTGSSNTTGSFNTYLGSSAGSSNVNGDSNTFIGTNSGNRSIGAGNTFVGSLSGFNNEDGSNNTCLGKNADVIGPNLSNSIAIGYNTQVDASNKVVIGNSSVSVIGGYANWMNLSDQRYKQKIKKEQNHLAFILKLNPVSYQYNTLKLVKERQKAFDQKRAAISRNNENNLNINITKELEDDLQKRNTAEIKAAQQKDKIRYTGFLAQEVEKAASEVGYQEFSAIVKPEINGGKYGLRYAEFVVPLVGAVQEQQQIIDRQQAQITERDEKIEQLSVEVAELKTMLETLIANQKTKNAQSAIIQSAKLGQNSPNPFENNTKIPYTIPTNAQSANMLVHNINGQLIHAIAIRQFGEGTLELQTTNLSNGQYTYSLEVDGQIVATQKMILQR